MIPIMDAFVQLMQQGAFFFIFLLILLFSNGLVIFFYRKSSIGKSFKVRMELLEKILDQIPDPVLYKDPLGKYLYCNTALENLWGIRREYIYGKTTENLLPKEAAVLNKVDRIIKDKNTTIKIGKWLTDSQEKDHFFEIHQMPFYPADSKGLQGILLFFNDVTRIKEETSFLNTSYEEIKRDLQERELFYSQFLRKAVQPLDSIQRNAEFLMDRVKTGQYAENSLRDIVEAGYLMDSYIRNLSFLAFPGQSPLASDISNDDDFTLEDWQNRLTDKCEQYSRDTGFSTYVLLFGDVPENLKVDFQVLDTLTDRLIENAERFAESGFYIMVRIYRVEEGHFSMNVSIRNMGRSIPQAMREEIFKPFFQLQEQENSRHAGLGLTVARQLAGKLGGSLSCDPSCGDGARFLLSLPPMEGSGAVISGHRLNGHCPGWPSSVLIADDEGPFREKLAGQMRNAGLKVYQAPDGEAAVEMAVEVKPDLLLADKKMPLMNGREVIRQVAEKLDTPSMEMYLMVSGYHLDTEPLFSEEDDRCSSLTKPIDWTLLLDILVRKR